MKVDLTKVMTNMDGQAFQQDGEDLTLKDVVIMTLIAPLDQEEQKKMTADKAVKRWRLAMDCHGKDEVEIEVDMVKELRDRIPKFYSVLVAGQACEILK